MLRQIIICDRISTKHELESILKEAVMVSFSVRVLAHYSPGDNEENSEKSIKVAVPSQDSNRCYCCVSHSRGFYKNDRSQFLSSTKFAFPHLEAI